MNKWAQWYESLPSHTKEYLKKQPIWHDCDLAVALGIGFVLGFVVGWLA